MANQTYWTFLREIIDLWMQYQSDKKLYINATHEETRFKVINVVNQYYGGQVAKVKKAENDLSESLDKKLVRFERYCTRLGVKPVTRDWLYHNVPDSKAANKYRRVIDKNRKNDAGPTAL